MGNLKLDDSAWHFSSSLHYLFLVFLLPVASSAFPIYTRSSKLFNLRRIKRKTKKLKNERLKSDFRHHFHLSDSARRREPTLYLGPRKSMQDKRKALHGFPPSFIPKDGTKISPALFFLSSFSSQREEAKLSPHFSKRNVKKESRSIVLSLEKKGREKKMSSLGTPRTFHNYDSLTRCETRVGAWKKFGTFRFVHNVLAATDHLCNKPSSSYLVRHATREGGERDEGREREEGGGRTLTPFIFLARRTTL